MKRLTSYLMVIAAVVAALAAVPTAQAGDPNSAAVRAIMLRSQELGRLCQNPTLSRPLYLGHCGTGAELRAVAQVATVRAAPTSDGFDWAEFGIGAGSMLGLALLAGGVATRVHGRKGSVRPRPAA